MLKSNLDKYTTLGNRKGGKKCETGGRNSDEKVNGNKNNKFRIRTDMLICREKVIVIIFRILHKLIRKVRYKVKK